MSESKQAMSQIIIPAYVKIFFAAIVTSARVSITI
jgi:hypothetical protein